MVNKFDKHYYERYAELTLYNVFPEWKSHFSRSDRPDLQNVIDNIGIEVTSSTPSIIRENLSYGAKLLGGKVSKKEEERYRGELFLTSERDVYAFSPTRGLIDADLSPEIISAISHKCSKWKGYKEYSKRGLYIFSGTSLFDKEMLKKIEESESFSFFQIVFINALDRLYYYDDGWKEKEFTDEELADFKKKALEGETSKTEKTAAQREASP